MDNPAPPKPTFSFGHAAHALVLGTGRQPVEIPAELLSADGGVRSKDAKAWVAQAQLGGKTPLKADEIQKADAAKATAATPPATPKTTESTAQTGAGKASPDAKPKPADPDVVKKAAKPRAPRKPKGEA